MLELAMLSAKGDDFNGTPFRGEVPAMVPNSSLAAMIGLSAGTVVNEGWPWLKFEYKEKTLYVPKRSVRYGLSWIGIYALGAVYGDDTNGIKPASVANTLQNRKITIDGKQYRVRLLTGAPTNPYPDGSGSDLSTTNPSEWNDLIYPITNDSSIITYKGPKIKNPYTPADLGHLNGFGNQHLVMNLTATAAYGYALTRGNNTSVAYVYSSNRAESTSNSIGWRPCLELIP